MFDYVSSPLIHYSIYATALASLKLLCYTATLLNCGTSLCVQSVVYSERCTSETERKTLQFEQEVKSTESLKANLDDDVATVPTANGGMRRKHHRPWTLGEVVKLVEGVSKYGAGRWSEIKRLAFSSYSYRTSVDLKVSGYVVNHICYTVGLLVFTTRID